MSALTFDSLAETELATLAAAIEDPVYAAKIREVNVWEFSTQDGRDTQAALKGCLDRDGVVSFFSVRQWLLSAEQGQSFSKVLGFLGGIVTPSEMDANIAAIRQSAARRKVRRAASEIQDLSEDQTVSWDEITGRLAGIVADVMAQTDPSQAKHLAELVQDYAKSERQLQEAREKGEDVTHIEGLPWPYHSWDQTVGLSKPGQVIIIAARPKMGKSVILGQTALHWGRYGVGYWWTGEMDASAIVSRVLPSDLRKPLENISLRDMDDYARELAPNVWIDTDPMMTAARLVGRVEAFRSRHKLRYVVLDHLGLLGDDYKSISAAIKMLRQYAGKWGVPILAACQLSRKGQDTTGPVRRPTAADLRESGRIEEEAAKVGLLHRPYYYDKNADKKLALVEFPLNRFGAPSDNRLEWRPEICSLWDNSGYQQQGPTNPAFPSDDDDQYEDVPLY